eukprot:c9792_g1_i2.p1 GENE.c9792_g1_i2~~c9792_g1_i2.p1  ORF type:complete len:195 (+),score=52.17 c9792_g1_i2:112-696(+)
MIFLHSCVAQNYPHRYSLDAARHFHTLHSQFPRFMYIDLLEGHEVSQRFVRVIDKDVSDFISNVMKDNRTIVALVSDHGMGDLGTCPSVTLEERLPLSMLLMPSEAISENMRDALTTNQKKVFTSLNLFETLARIPRRFASGEEYVGKPNIRPWSSPLFEKLPDHLCKEAGVEVHACACSRYDMISHQKPPLRW